MYFQGGRLVVNAGSSHSIVRCYYYGKETLVTQSTFFMFIVLFKFNIYSHFLGRLGCNRYLLLRGTALASLSKRKEDCKVS